MKKDNEKKQILKIMQDEDSVILSSATIKIMRIKDYKKMSLEQQSVCSNIFDRLDETNQIQKERGFGEVWGIEVAVWELIILFQDLSVIPEHSFTIPAEYYRSVYRGLKPVEQMEISQIIPYKSCASCDKLFCDEKTSNPGYFCDNWCNKEEIGKAYTRQLVKNPYRKN